ncbi:hypothetical protein BGZ75_000836 [Mortierella antarctica]|nr:hypothetical protein BGZ75_000836 [Mortierella antarctica]
MAPAGKKADKRWRFVGQEVKDVENLTPAHIRSVYGLGAGLEHDSDQEFTSAGAFPYCGDRHSSSSTLKLSSVKGATPCSAARCKDNPHCLNYMGQTRWEEADAFDEFYAAVSDTPTPSYNKRPVDKPSGMKNLGATCYANSLLQVWFHDLAFRDAIYRCRFDKDTDSSMNALYQLQLLFAHLDHGAKNVYNPLSLVSSLKLDTTMQQDAQEFGNLFMACIDNQLQSQSDVLLRDFIKDQFQGHYQYHTTCKNCKTTSVRSCVFYELLLNIKNNCTLMDCFEEFVESEPLVGVDRSQKWFVLNDEEVAEFNATAFDPEEMTTSTSKFSTKSTAASPGATENYLNQETIRRAFEKAKKIRQELCRCWSVNRDQDGGCYISSEILAEYMRLQKPDLSKDTVESNVVKFDNAEITCEHRKLSPSAVTKSKRINKLYNIMHRRDVDEYERRAKAVRSAPGAWLSKAWLAEWLKVLPQFHPAHGSTADDLSPMSEAYRPDVFCTHSCLSSNKLTRKLINEAALGVLERVFGPLSLPGKGAEECKECFQRMQPYIESERDMVAMAASEKREFTDLINRGATLRRMEPGIIYYAVSQDFRKMWLDFIKKPTVSPRPASLDNSKLLCDHGQLVFDLDNPMDAEDESGIGIVKEEEWRYLQALYGGAPAVSVTKTHSAEADDGKLDPCSRTVSVPKVCSPCRSRRVLDYSTTTFTVRVYSAGNGALSQLAPQPGHAVPAVASAFSGSTESPSKRRMMPLLPKADEGTRRSKRTRATKSPFKQIRILVNKWETTMDLKLKIMQKTEIVPLYQKLLYGDVELDRNDRTIGELELPPNAVLTLIEFDDAMDDLMLDALQGPFLYQSPLHYGPPCPEEEPRYEGGFTGTGLSPYLLFTYQMDLDSEVQGADPVDTASPRQLVLDYLLHNCYGETARAFMKDDLDAVKDSDSRKGIRTSGNGHHLAPHNGNDGTTTANGTHHNGLTGASHMQAGTMAWSTSDANHQRNESPSSFMELEKEQELDQEGDSPMAESFVDSSSDHITAGTFTAGKAHALHIDEQLKNLETRKAIRSLISHGDIEKAIELCNSAFPGVLSIEPRSPLTTPASIQMNFRLQCQLFIEKLRSDPAGHEALMFAQKFLHQFNQLDPARKEQYTLHVVDLVSLVAYSKPEEAPSGHHMKQEARDRLAEFMNSAVLGCNGMSCEPALLTIVKQVTLVRDILTGETPKTKRGSKKPSIPVRIPNDDTMFNPKEYPNVVFEATGKMSGTVVLVHTNDDESDTSGLGRISTRIWVVRESDKDKVVITPSFDNNTHTFRLQAPDDYTSNAVYHQTTISYPRTAHTAESLTVSAPNTSFSGKDLYSLAFGVVRSTLSNGPIALENAQADRVQLTTSNGSISGSYEAGHVDFVTSNGSIRSKLTLRDALDKAQSKVSAKTTNGPVDLHITATKTNRGLWMQSTSVNGKLSIGVLLGKADRASYINTLTSNSKIDFNLDALKSGQSLEVNNITTNGSIVSSMMVPKEQPFKGTASSTNGSVSVNLTEEFHGRFALETTHGNATVEGSDVIMERDMKSAKQGYRGSQGPSSFTIRTTNGSTGLRFYPSGQSSA